MIHSAEPTSLHERIESLEQEISALAEANIRAAELMAELEDARAVSAALERRAEELTLQHCIDQIILEQRDPGRLCERVLATLRATAGLELSRDGAACLHIEGRAMMVATCGELPATIVDALQAATLDGLTEPDFPTENWLFLPLSGQDGPLGLLALSGRMTPAWEDRWQGLLRTLARAVGGAIDRIRMEAERKRMAEELERRRDEALAASRAKSRFLANMSHELRTPLNAVIGYSEMLHDEAVEDGLERYAVDLEKVVRAGRHLLGLISDILDLSKIEAGRIELERRTFAVRDMVSDVVATARPLIEANANAFVIDVDGAVDQMTGDEARMRQCLINLLGNAAKFTDHGTVTLEVRVQPGRLRFVVRDTGIGMSEEQLARCFEAFTQADASATRKYGGTGLGLAITRALCEAMNGSADVCSQLGHGTEFEIVVPA